MVAAFGNVLRVKWFMKLMTKPKEIRPGLTSSINAAYTIQEIQSILSKTDLKSSTVKKTMRAS